MKEDILLEIVQDAMELFNKSIPGQSKKDLNKWSEENNKSSLSSDTDYSSCPIAKELIPFYPFSMKNTVVAFFTPDKGVQTYSEFCRKYFPRKLDATDPLSVQRFHNIAAEAFVGHEKNGILLRSDIDCSYEEYRHFILHELAHIYCTRTEMPCDEHFADIYLGSTTDEQAEQDPTLDGYISAGYTIWREFIAEYLAYNIDPYGNQVALLSTKRKLQWWLKQYDLAYGYPDDQKRALVNIFTEIMESRDVLMVYGDTDHVDRHWNTLLDTLEKMEIFEAPSKTDRKAMQNTVEMKQSFYLMLCDIFYQIMKPDDDCFEWNITKDFIMELGKEYVDFKTARVALF